MTRLVRCLAIAALSVAAQAATAQTGTAPFCLQTPTGTRCSFGTMGECESARGSTSGSQCMTSTDARGTTGLGKRPPPPSGPPPQSPAIIAPPDQDSH